MSTKYIDQHYGMLYNIKFNNIFEIILKYNNINDIFEKYPFLKYFFIREDTLDQNKVIKFLPTFLLESLSKENNIITASYGTIATIIYYYNEQARLKKLRKLKKIVK